MCDNDIRRFLRYYYKPIVDFALDLAELDDRERQAVQLCGRRRLTIEQASEEAGVSVCTMQTRWANARKRLQKSWQGLEWVQKLAECVDE